MSMRILIIDVYNYMSGGVNYFSSFHLYDLLKNNGYVVDILKYPLYENNDDINVIDFQTALSKKYDIIFVASVLGFDYVNKYKKQTKLDPKIIIIDEENYLNKIIYKTKFFDFRTKNILKTFISSLHTDDICLTSDYVEMNNIKTLGIKTDYIQPYISENYFLKDSIELKYIQSNPILFLNKLDFDQNSLDILIKAVKHIKNKTDFLEKYNLLIDVTAFGKDYEKFVKQVYKNKLGDLFRFVNIMPNDKYSTYIRNHKFTIVLPKKNNMHNRVILESMASGVPVLIDSSYNTYSDPYIKSITKEYMFSNKMTEIIKDTLNGVVFESDNYIDLAEKIMLLSYTDLTDMKKNAYETALKFKPFRYDNRMLTIVKHIVDEMDKVEMMSEL